MFKFFLFFTLIYSYAFATPSWFGTNSLDRPLFSMIGYGSSEDLEKAQAQAREDISSQLSSTITSSLDIKLSDTNGKIDKSVSTNTKSTSSAVLDTTKVLRSEKVGDIFYVALLYQNIPKLKCPKKQNKFLANSSLINDANLLLNCRYDYDLRYMDESWYLKYKTINEKLSQAQFDTFFKTVANDKLSIKSEKNTYEDGESFSLKITSKADGYLSLVVVYEDGKVGVLLSNEYINKDKAIKFPSEQSQEEMIAGLVEYNKATKDLYFAFISPKTIDLTSFQEQENKQVGESEYRFNDVIKLSEVYEFSTILLRTKP